MSGVFEWYVVHTFSGYEAKVKTNMEKAVESYDMSCFFDEIKIPTEETITNKNGKKKVSQRKIFPGYVFIKMVMNDESWYVVRNCRGVTGFVGPGSKPLPLTKSEISKIGIENKVRILNFDVNDTIVVKSGALEGFVGVVQNIDFEKEKVKTKVSMFGRDTDVELDFDQVEVFVE